jgi:hypothetical protein
MESPQFVLVPFIADALIYNRGRRPAVQDIRHTLRRRIPVRKIAFLALAAGAMLFAAPADAVPLTGGVSQGYSDYLNQTIVEVKGGRHGHHARGGHRHHHHARRHHHHRHFALRIHRRHHDRWWYEPCPYGYILEYGRCVPYLVR